MSLNKTLAALFYLCLGACSVEESHDTTMLEKDRRIAHDRASTIKVDYYKVVKIATRSSVAQDRLPPELQALSADLAQVSAAVIGYTEIDPEERSIVDRLRLVRNLSKLRSMTTNVDEDVFPTLTDVFQMQRSDTTGIPYTLLSGEEKLHVQSGEHTVLSIFALLTKDLGEDISFYECLKTDAYRLEASEVKALIRYYRGLLFFQKGLYYMAEAEFSDNIAWVEANKDADPFFMRVVFQWRGSDDRTTNTAFHALNHLMRGLTRSMMDRKVDEERALDDFETFLDDAREIGLDNELVWSVEAYLYLKHEESDKAIASLTKLRSSPRLGANERKQLDTAIGYVRDREPGKALNGVYDKVLLGRIASEYLLSLLAEVDWKQLLVERGVPHAERMFEALDGLKAFITELEKYAGSEGGDAAEKGIKDLFHKAKEALN